MTYRPNVVSMSPTFCKRNKWWGGHCNEELIFIELFWPSPLQFKHFSISESLSPFFRKDTTSIFGLENCFCFDGIIKSVFKTVLTIKLSLFSILVICICSLLYSNINWLRILKIFTKIFWCFISFTILIRLTFEVCRTLPVEILGTFLSIRKRLHSIPFHSFRYKLIFRHILVFYVFFLIYALQLI